MEEIVKPSLFMALCKAQSVFKPAVKDSTNPHFRSSYADLSSIWDACKEGLAQNGLFVSQFPAYEGEKWLLYTKVYNEYGENIACSIPILCATPNSPQAFGSAMTYARRYSLAAILGIITDDDDDANAASPKQAKAIVASSAKPTPAKVEETDEMATDPQIELIQKLIKSSVFTEEEKNKTQLSLSNGITKATAIKLIDKLQKEITSRKSVAKDPPIPDA